MNLPLNEKINLSENIVVSNGSKIKNEFTCEYPASDFFLIDMTDFARKKLYRVDTLNLPGVRKEND